MKTSPCLTLLFFVLTLILGCGESRKKPASLEKFEINPGLYKIIIIGHGDQPTMSSKSFNGDWTYKFGALTVESWYGRLLVNDHFCCDLKVDTQITISNNVVFVDGTLVQPTPLSREQFEMKYPLREEDFMAGNHQVTLRFRKPAWVTEKNILGTHVFKNGLVQVKIKNNNLYVDGKRIQRLAPGDKLVVDEEKVFVSESEVWVSKKIVLNSKGTHPLPPPTTDLSHN